MWTEVAEIKAYLVAVVGQVFRRHATQKLP
jgi:hypothetical protein